MKVVGRHYSSAEPIELEIEGGKIRAVRRAAADDWATLPWIAPGFVDLQVNGYRGLDFTSSTLTVAEVVATAKALDETGVTRFLATVTTQSPEVMLHAIGTIGQACAAEPEAARRIVGIHVEGPYICPEDGPRGAHPRSCVRPPDLAEFARWQAASGGRVKLVTLSPEWPGAAEFIAEAVRQKVLIAIGHTQATREQLAAAVEAGAAMSTHLGNAAHALLPRHVNYLWEQLANDDLAASLIADGWHLPPPVLKSLLRGKTPGRCILVSDITGMAGMPPGRYSTGLGEVEVLDDGRLVVAGQRQYLAGAAAPIGVGVANLMRYAGLDRATAVELATIRPAILLGLPRDRLNVGSIADFILFDLPGADGRGPLGELSIRATYNDGEEVYRRPS
jgi:N-acetylglucosamine-6-phosphate deacetylase